MLPGELAGVALAPEGIVPVGSVAVPEAGASEPAVARPTVGGIGDEAGSSPHAANEHNIMAVVVAHKRRLASE